MKNKDRTKEPLLEEIEHLKAKIAQQKKYDAERKKVITALKESEERYRTIVESSNDVIFQIDTHGKFVFANEQALTLLGYHEGDGLGKSFTHFVPKREIPRYLKQLAKVIRGEEVHNFVTAVYHKDGHLIPIEISGKLIKQRGKTVGQGVVRDISLRMAAQKASRESARLLREAAQIAHLGYWDLDIVTNHLQWSDEVYKMFGIVSEKFEASYEAILQFIHPDDRDQVATAFSDSLKDKTTFNVIHRIVLPSGEIKYVREKCRTEYDKNGNPVRSLGIVLDITQQMEAELDLQQNREYLREIFNATTDAIFIHDGETGKILDVNEQMCTMFGYDKKEVLLSNIQTYSLGISPYSDREVMEQLVKSRKEGTQTFEWLARHKDGHLFWVEVSLRFTTIGGEKRYIASVRNIEDRKQAKKEIHHLNRVYAALSHINKAIVRIKDRNELFIQACKIAIDDGKFMMSWIGIVNPESHKVEVVSSYGKIADYLENINIDMLDPKLRKGPTGTTIQTGKHTYSNDIETDSKMAPWHKKALDLGYKSSIALPLTIEGKTIGAYMMYSAEKDFFNKAEINLLDELASDISFALEYIEKEKLRKQAEQRIRQANARLHILHDLDTAILESVSVETIAQSGLQWLHQISKAIRISIALFDEEENRATVYSRGLLERDIGHAQKVNLQKAFPDIGGMKNGEVIKISDLNTEKNVVEIMQRFKKEGILSFVNIPILAHGELLGSLNFGYKKPNGFTNDELELGNEVADTLAIAMEQARLHSALKVHAKALEEKVAERTAQLEHSNNELREFAQVVSHDLKAPLRAISQLSYWLSQDYADKIDNEGQKQFEMLIGRVKRLDNLIDGILQYSRAGKVREKEKNIDLQKLIAQTVTLLNPPANIKITVVNKLPTYVGDPTRLGQLFQNLIDNAIKYMDKPQGVIKIGCKKRAEFWEFYVSDNGPGIEEKYFDRIFQIFQRLVARDDMEGTGVGLSLVKRIVQIYGGDIWLESKIGEGTTFYFTLAVGKKEKKR